MMRFLRKFSAVSMMIALLFLLSGCSYRPLMKNMVPQDPNLTFASSGKSLRVATPPSSEFSQLRQLDFYLALRDALIKSKSFTDVKNADPSDYILNVSILQHTPQLAGLDMTSVVVIKYQLLESGSRKGVCDTTLTTECTKTMGDALIGAQRSNMASECAVRENIKGFLTFLSSLKL
jgi:hypothetical protein